MSQRCGRYMLTKQELLHAVLHARDIAMLTGKFWLEQWADSKPHKDNRQHGDCNGQPLHDPGPAISRFRKLHKESSII